MSVSTRSSCPISFFFNDTATTEIYTLSLHDALPIFHPIGIEGEKAPARAQQAKDFPGARRRVGKVVHDAAQERAVKSFRGEGQVLDVAGDEFDPRMLAPPDLQQFGADVETDAVVAGARDQRREGAGAAAEIDDPRAGLQPRELDERLDEARARLRGEHVVVVGRSMAVEERDLFLLVLG